MYKTGQKMKNVQTCESQLIPKAKLNKKNKIWKLFKLIFMARFIKILEQIRPIAEGATARLVPMQADEDAQKINEDCH